jgi:hypothetical protein
MHKIMVILLLSVGVCQAETKLYSDGLNLPAGSSYQVGNRTLYQDALNLPFASKTDLGSISVFANFLNLPSGAVVVAGPNVFGNDYQPIWESKGFNYEPF